MATVSPQQPETWTPPPPADSYVVLYNVAWHTYIELRDIPENYHRRMTYDEGILEIMSPSARHGSFASLMDRMVSIWVEELDIPARSLRDLTCRREDLKKGLEPDDCYYVQNEPRMWDRDDVDLTVDPPPDLAIEVEVSRSSVGKMPIYAALGVPELWRYDGEILRIYELVGGQYQSRETSICFPRFPVTKAEEVLRQVRKVRETTLMRGFRKWVRETFVGE